MYVFQCDQSVYVSRTRKRLL